MNQPLCYRVYRDPLDDSPLFGATMDANGLEIVGGIVTGRSAAVVHGGAFTDIASGPEARHIIIKQGLQANLPLLLTGEFGLATDTRRVYLGVTPGGESVEVQTTTSTFKTNQSVSATAVSTVARVLPVYDAGGNLLGYIPIYSGFTPGP